MERFLFGDTKWVWFGDKGEGVRESKSERHHVIVMQ